MINEFQKEYRFLSNFWPINVVLDGEIYPSVEHAYQAAKTLDLKWRNKICNCNTPGQSKRMGRKAPLRSDWNNIKVKTMRHLLNQKFENQELLNLLLDTYPHIVQEGNRWGDKFWGICLKTGQGKNYLGKILMLIRENYIRQMED